MGSQHQVMRTLRLYQEVYWEKLRPPANGHLQLARQVSEPPWEQIQQPQLNLQMMQPQATSWLKPQEGCWARTSQLSHSWIPDPQKWCEIKFCCFKPLSVYIGIDDKYRGKTVKKYNTIHFSHIYLYIHIYMYMYIHTLYIYIYIYIYI